MAESLEEQVDQTRLLMRARVGTLVDRYIARLTTMDSPLILEGAGIEAAKSARSVLESAFSQSPSRHTHEISAFVGKLRAEQNIPPQVSIEAAQALFDVVAQDATSLCLAKQVRPEVHVELLNGVHNALLHRIVGAAVPYASELLRQVHAAQQNERRRIARDMHDHVAHAIAICVQQLELHQFATDAGHQEAAEAHMDLVRDYLLDASELVHELALEIGQSQTGEGFVRALNSYVDLHGEGRISLSVANSERIEDSPADILEEFFLALREAIRNALRHSISDKIDVAVGALNDELRATVSDHGVGFSLPRSRQSSGTGLVSMKERIAILGGTTSIRSAQGSGTIVDMRIPILVDEDGGNGV